MRFVEFYNSLLQDSYQQITTLLSRDLNTLIKRSQHSYQKISALLSRHLSIPVKRLQHSYQQITALLSTDYNTLINRLQHSYQQITAKHNKMLEYLNFFLLCSLFALIFYLYTRTKRHINLLKMAEDNLIFSGYDPPQLDTKKQKLLEWILTRNS